MTDLPVDAQHFAPDSNLATRIHPSSNFGLRREDFAIDVLILHYTGMPSAEGAIKWLATPEAEVSCHYVVDEAGAVTQMVPEKQRAWHAGVSHWGGVD